MFDISRAARSAVVAAIAARHRCRARPGRLHGGPCARSMSASRCRRRTSCTPRPMWPRSSAIFAKHCIDATIIQFDGGCSPAATAARRPRHRAVATVSDVADRPRHEGAADLGLAPAAAAGLRGRPGHQDRRRSQGQAAERGRRRRRRLQLAMGREVLKRPGSRSTTRSSSLKRTAGRLPACCRGQIDAVALHPERRLSRA